MSWRDHVVRVGVTVKYGATGPEGQLKSKKAILVLGRGGMYSDGPIKVFDHQETYLRTVLGFVGITDVETIAIEGVALGPEARAKSVEGAKTRAANIGVKAV